MIGLPLLSLGLWGACRRRPIAIPRRPVPAATAALARASSCPPADSADGRGWKRRDEIEGLKLFLDVAEADRLRVLNPPDFTPALYEKLLPYAVALGVEIIWNRRFATALAASRIQYQPDWYDGSHPWNRSDTVDFSSNPGGGLSTAIAARLDAPISGGGWLGGGARSAAGIMGGGSDWLTPPERCPIHERHSAPAFGEDSRIRRSQFPRAIQVYDRLRGLDRVGGGS